MRITIFEETLKSIDEFCKDNTIPYSVIGGLALIFHKIQRTTKDIDITLPVELENMEAVGNLIIKYFDPAIADPIPFFQRNFVLPVINKKTKIRINFVAGLTGFDKQVVKRSKRRKFGKLSLPFCTIEDLILYKLFASRHKDIADLYEISKFYKNNLDQKYLSAKLNEFIELERKDMKENFEKIFK